MGGETPEQKMRKADPEFGSNLRPMTVQQIQDAQRLTGAPVTAPAPATSGPSRPALAQATAGASYDMPDVANELAIANQGPMPSMPDPYASSGLAMQTAMDQQGRQGKGILDTLGIQTDNFGKRLANALMAAGSDNPAKTIATLLEQDEVVRKERSEASKTKVTPLQGGAFSMVTYPGGRTEIIRNDQVAQFIEQTSGDKFMQRLMLADRNAQNQLNVAGGKADIAAAEAAKPILSDVQGLTGRWKDALKIVSDQGTGAQLQGVFPGVAGFFGMDEAARNKILQGLTVSETLLNTALTKGAISNAEMTLFKSPIPSLTDDREKVWKPWIEERLKVLNKMEEKLGKEAMRGQTGGSSSTGRATSAPSSILPKAGKFFDQ